MFLPYFTYLRYWLTTLYSVFNNIVKVSRLDISSNYHLFKKGIRPEWEDAANEHGGKFSVQFPKNRTGEAINDLWLYTVRIPPFLMIRMSPAVLITTTF